MKFSRMRNKPIDVPLYNKTIRRYTTCMGAHRIDSDVSNEIQSLGGRKKKKKHAHKSLTISKAEKQAYYGAHRVDIKDHHINVLFVIRM